MTIQIPSRWGSQGVYSSIHQGGQEGFWVNGRPSDPGDAAWISMKSDNIKDIMLLTREELEKAGKEGKHDQESLPSPH